MFFITLIKIINNKTKIEEIKTKYIKYFLKFFSEINIKNKLNIKRIKGILFPDRIIDKY